MTPDDRLLAVPTIWIDTGSPILYAPSMGQEPQSPESARAKLAAELDLAPWSELKPHALADRLFVVAGELDILEVAVAVARDSATEVANWVRTQSLARPGQEQVEVWDQQPSMLFRCVIVAPFVLAQRPLPQV